MDFVHLATDTGRQIEAVWMPEDLKPEGEWEAIAGPFDPATETQLLLSHLRQVSGTWSVLVESGPDELFICRHVSELNPFSQLSGGVFPRPGLAPWTHETAEYWCQNGAFKRS